MMTATGLLFLAKAAPHTSMAADGTFALTLLAFDRIGLHQVEPWRIIYSGPGAQMFWDAYKGELQPGQPINISATRMRLFTNGRNGGPEVHAIASVIELAPLAHPKSDACITSY